MAKQFQSVKTGDAFDLLYNDNNELVAIHRPGFIGLVGMHSAESVAEVYNALGSTQQDSTLFFPGNNDHHTKKTTLFSKKEGSGLAHLARDLHNKQAAATMSLPTRFWGKTEEEDLQAIDDATRDFWRSYNAGQTIVLPIRAQYNGPGREPYFNQPLLAVNGMAFEPSFWGQAVKEGDPELAKLYMGLFQDALKGNVPADHTALPAQHPFLQPEKPAPTLPAVQVNNVVNPFMAKFHGYTSDHAERTATVNFVNASNNQVDLSANVMTWNLMNKCVSDQNAAHKNNPLNDDEDAQQYAVRKRLQFEQIKQRIIEAKTLEQPLDFIMLQEIDFLEGPRRFDDDQTGKVKHALLNEFRDMLKSVGYDIVIRSGGPNSKALAVAYKEVAWTWDLVKGRKPVLTESGRSCGVELDFEHKLSGKNCTVTPLHLDYNTDYRKAIADYQQQKVDQNGYMIMGGDTNHPQNHESENMIVNFSKYPSNIDGVKSAKTNQYEPTDKQVNPDKKEYLKCYDGFFVNPGKHSYVHIVETQGSYFDVQKDGTVAVHPMPGNRGHVQHTSLVGRAWKPTRYILKEWDGQLSVPADKVYSGEHSEALVKQLTTMVEVYNSRMFAHNNLEFDQYAQQSLTNPKITLPNANWCFQQDNTLLERIKDNIAFKNSAEYKAVGGSKTVDALRSNLEKLAAKFPNLSKEHKQFVNHAKAHVLSNIYEKERQSLNALKSQVSKYMKWGFLIVPLFFAWYYHRKLVAARDKLSVRSYELKKPNQTSFAAAMEKFDESPTREVVSTSGAKQTKIRKAYLTNKPGDASFSKMGSSSLFKGESKERVKVFLTEDNDMKRFEKNAREKGSRAIRV